jgi:hypothetical protein
MRANFRDERATNLEVRMVNGDQGVWHGRHGGEEESGERGQGVERDDRRDEQVPEYTKGTNGQAKEVVCPEPDPAHDELLNEG